MLREAQIDFVDGGQNVTSTESLILDLDLNTMKKEDVNFASEYSVTINRNSKLHGLVGWFDCIFEDPKKPHHAVTLSTSPFKKGTHWKQTTFYMNLKEQLNGTFGLEVKKGDTLYGSLACIQNKKNFRELDIKISYHLKRTTKDESGETSKKIYDGVELYKVR